jgi:glycosyltransferase involved in cell wall biosynthesis
MKSIALFNPSYQHEQERSLWNSLYREFNDKGYEIFEFQCRVIPVNSHGTQYIFPARLKDFGKKIRLGDLDLPNWFIYEELEFSVNWEKRRWELNDSHRDEIERGAIRLAQTIELFFRTHKPELVIVYNEIDHPQRLATLAAKAHGVPVKIMERSPFMGIWLEDFGLFHESRAFIDKLPDANPIESRSLIRMLSEQIEGFREGQFREGATIDRYIRPIIFLVLDNFLWTAKIENTLERYKLHYQPISDLQAVIDRLTKLCNGLGGQLIVKPHPSCKEAKKLTYSKEVLYYTGNLPDVLRSADVVVGWNSKVLFNALALEKPVICLGANPVLATNACYSIEKLDDLDNVLTDALHHVGLEERLDSFSRKLPSLVSLQYFSIDMSAHYSLGAPFTLMVEDLLQSAKPLELISRPCIENWYSLSEGKLFDWKIDEENLKSSNKIQVLFEASRLRKEKLCHSGISRYVREFIEKINSNKDIYFTAACWEDGNWIYYAGDPLLSENEYDLFHSPHEPLRAVKARRRLITIHDVIHLKIRSYYPKKEVPINKYHVYKVLESLQPQDYIVCDSNATRRDLLSFNLANPDNVSVVYLGVEKTSHFDTTDKIARGKNIFILYQEDARKNSEIYFQIASLLQDAAPDWRLFMVASDSMGDKISKELGERGCENVEIFLSPSDKEKVTLMNQCAFSIFLPLYEGFGFPVLESLAAGLPIIASSTSSLQELEHTGIKYVSPFSWVDIRQAILEWVENPETIVDAEEFQDDITRLFSWERTVSDTVALYFSIVNHVQVRNPVVKKDGSPAKLDKTTSKLNIIYDAKLSPWRYFLYKIKDEMKLTWKFHYSFSVYVISLIGGIFAWYLASFKFGFAISLLFSGLAFFFILFTAYVLENNLLRRFYEFVRDNRG